MKIFCLPFGTDSSNGLPSNSRAVIWRVGNARRKPSCHESGQAKGRRIRRCSPAVNPASPMTSDKEQACVMEEIEAKVEVEVEMKVKVRCGERIQIRSLSMS